MAEPFLSELRLFSFVFAPKGWALCNGQFLPINQNQALFSLLGTTYGGNGQTTFALPDLRGRAPVSSGQGPGLSSYNLGEVTGTENVNVTVNQMPMHTHVVTPPASSGNADQVFPTGAISAAAVDGGGTNTTSFTKTAANVSMAPINSSPAGG